MTKSALAGSGVRRILGAIVQTLPLTVPAALISIGIAGMILLLLNVFYAWLLLLVGLPAAGGMVWLAVRYGQARKRPGGRREQMTWDMAVALGVLLWIGLNIPFSAQHVFTDRDPATYAVTGAWLVTHHDLHIPVAPSAQAFPALQAGSLGFGISLQNDKEIYAQGAHFLPVLLGFFGKLVGQRAMLGFNVLFGGAALLAFYGFARLMLRPRWAALATAVLATTLPFIYFSRDTYTEPLTLMAIFASLTFLWVAVRSRALLGWLLVGICAGTTALLRTDTYLLLAALEAYAAFYVMIATKPQRRPRLTQVLVAIVPAAILGFVGWLDVSQLSSGYYHDVRIYMLAQFVFIAFVTVAAGAAIVLAWRTRLLVKARWLLMHKHTRHIITAALAAFFIVLLVRAVVLFVLATLGRADNMPVESYSAKTTLLWVIWYIGPVLAVAGVYQLVRGWPELLHGQLLELLPLFLVLSADCALYLLRPGISPDQIWASRRFLPVIFPGFVLLGTYLLQGFSARQQLVISKHWLPARKVVIALGVLTVGLPILTSLPFWQLQPFSELSQVEAVCRSLPANALVVWAGSEGAFAVQPTQAFCGVESVASTASAAGLQAVWPELEQYAVHEHKALVLGANSDDAASLPPSVRAQVVSSLTYTEPEHTYKRFPLKSISHTQTLVLAPAATGVAIQR